MTERRILIAGVGNIFRGDDAFGSEAARRLATRPLPDGVRVVDFGIRGFDLACAIAGDCHAVVLLDAMRRGGEPGSLYVVEPEFPEADDDAQSAAPHDLSLGSCLRLARSFGRIPLLRLIGCEPATIGSDDEGVLGLSPPVATAVDRAVALAEALVADLMLDAGHA